MAVSVTGTMLGITTSLTVVPKVCALLHPAAMLGWDCVMQGKVCMVNRQKVIYSFNLSIFLSSFISSSFLHILLYVLWIFLRLYIYCSMFWKLTIHFLLIDSSTHGFKRKLTLTWQRNLIFKYNAKPPQPRWETAQTNQKANSYKICVTVEHFFLNEALSLDVRNRDHDTLTKQSERQKYNNLQLETEDVNRFQ